MHNDSPHKKLFETGAIVSLRLALAIVMSFNLMPYQKTSAAETLFEARNNGKTIPVVSLSKNPRAFAYLTGMMIDADGAPNAYGPGNCGIDDLSNAGKPGHWWALATD